MTFTTAVIESASNIVQHAEQAGQEPVELGVEITVHHGLLEARLRAHNAKAPTGSLEPFTPNEDAESGRGLALIQALLTTVTFERRDATNIWILTRTSQQKP